MVPKFRAYIKDLDDLDYNDVPHKGHFVYGNLIKGKPNDDVDAIVGDLIEIHDEYVNVEWWCSIEKGSAEQYTGLKDANGKKIYEGDIIEATIEGCIQDDKYLVKNMWDPHVWTEESDNYYAVSKMEVKGNLHEDPELLEAQHDTRTD
ncbi:YopX family protein [Levilactobacillus brevis]|uniref:YopX family protein n=1 Tax=Levilactobacillus brevis TaxID=1580 RepID=UPI001F1F437E|nr:YopX family protein [Levilactobacillus brevis]MCE6020027.1 YopX family protein [Levilactobacillus brevis]